MHSHPYEQTGYLVKGHILLKIGDTQHDTRPRRFLVHPRRRHPRRQIIEDSIAIEIFSPSGKIIYPMAQVSPQARL